MRLLIVCALCVLAAPAAAQRFDFRTINGVRVWSLKPPQREPIADDLRDPETTASMAAVEPVDAQSINGVRVWRPEPSPEPFVVAPPLPPISITINQANYGAAYPDYWDYPDYGGYPAYWDYGGEFRPRPYGRRLFYHGGLGGRSSFRGGSGFHGGFGRR